MEFVIPLNKDDLLQSHPGQYYVKDVVSPRCINEGLDATRKSLEKKGPEFIFEHFDIFFSVILHGKNLDINIIFRAYDRIIKSFGFLVNDLEKEMLDSSRQRYLSMMKMHSYLLSHLMCYLEDATHNDNNAVTTGKKGKTAKKSDSREEWEHRREAALVIIYRCLQLPLSNLWQPTIVEEAFIMLLADICYKILEHDKDAREKNLKQTIWQILGTLVKRYIHGMTCKIKIVQLVRMYDALAQSLASGVILMVTENNCPSFISEILQEIEQTNLEEAEARNIASFIEKIASTQPNLILKNLNNILDYTSSDCYVMRNCAIEVIGHVILGCLKGETLDSELIVQRDECLEHLMERKLDANTYVRSKLFQTWQKLISEHAMPVQHLSQLIGKIVPHLEEKSTVMKKQTLQLIRVLLQCNPFSGVLDLDKFKKTYDEAEAELKKVQADVVAESASGDEERCALWLELSPRIEVAIKRSLEKDEEEMEDDHEDEEEDMGEINLDEEFESIRRLMIGGKVQNAVKCFMKICDKLSDIFDISNVERDTKEQMFLILLLKIFLGSEQDGMADKAKFDRAEWRKKIEKIQKYRQVADALKSAVNFVTEIEKTMPLIEQLLYSATPAVAIEACTLLGTAYQFKINGAAEAIHTALAQVFSREESVRNNVAIVYKEIYLKNDNNITDRQKAILSVNRLINLLENLKEGQSPALTQLMAIWFASGDLNDDTLQVMWEKYSFKFSDTTIRQSRCAVMLLAMVAQSQPKLISTNLNTLIKVGLKERARETRESILLARDTCRALEKIQTDSGDPIKAPVRYPNDHELFQELSTLLVDTFEVNDSRDYASFATHAINAIYHLANQPDQIITNILMRILEEHPEDVPSSYFSKLLYVIGHVAIAHMVYLDDVYKDMKRRNVIRDNASKKKKTRRNQRNVNDASITSTPSTSMSEFSSARKARRSIYRRNMSIQEDPEKDTLSGAVADDADAEAIDEALENCVVNGNGFLVQFVPLVLEVCQYPEKFKDEETKVWGVLALSKMMTVSSVFCNQHMQLLITILEKSTNSCIRSNILIGLSDLMIRFPNDVEPWTTHMYNRLRDRDTSVRRTALRVLSNLVKREMIRVKGQMAEMALCIVDEDNNIRSDAESFFYELSQKGNVLYNIMPDILSRLTSTEVKIDEDDLHKILKKIMGLLHKERETDALMDKICARFRLATTERQWRDLSYCLTLLPLGKKGISRLTVNLPLLKDKLHNRQVYSSLRTIIEAAKKKVETKAVVAVLEQEFEKLLENDESNNKNKQNTDNIENGVNNDNTESNMQAEADQDSDTEAMPPPPKPPKKKVTRRRRW